MATPINILSAENPEGRIDVGRAVGSAATAVYIYDLQPGQSSSPYHYEYEEEWLLVVDGTIVLRGREGDRTLERGDLVCFPPGPGGAHKIMNRSHSQARTLMFSSSRSPAAPSTRIATRSESFPTTRTSSSSGATQPYRGRTARKVGTKHERTTHGR